MFTHVHIPLLLALTAVGAGIALAIEQAGDDQLDVGSRRALAGGAALYLACVTVAQRATLIGFPPRTVRSRAVAVVLLVVLALAGADITPLAFTALTTGVLVVLVAFKLASAQRELRASSAPEPTGTVAEA